MSPKIIYNVTINIDESIHAEWKFWVKKHILQVLATGKFLSAKLTRVLVEEAQGDVTYSIQYTAISRQALDLYYQGDNSHSFSSTIIEAIDDNSIVIKYKGAIVHKITVESAKKDILKESGVDDGQ